MDNSVITQKPKFYRTGKDHRAGWIVGFVDVRHEFGFRTMKLGKWVTAGEKEESAARFYDALCDLRDILGGTSALISLRESLSLNYGTGGQRGVAAHYEPSTQTFALAKNAGPGSIAHEWFHAFDHYIMGNLFESSRAKIFASELYGTRASRIKHPLNDLLYNVYEAVLQKNNNPLLVQSKLADKDNRKKYYSHPYEMCARAFEAYVQDAGIKNNFLVKGTKLSDEAKKGLYPQGAQRLAINKAFAAYFDILGHALKKQALQNEE